jgi:hypothetical protein
MPPAFPCRDDDVGLSGCCWLWAPVLPFVRMACSAVPCVVRICRVCVQILCSPFKPRWRYWNSVLLAVRMLAVAIAAFAPTPQSRLLTLTVLFAVWAAAQHRWQPFREQSVNWHQNVCCFLLLLMSLLSLPDAVLTTAAIPTLNSDSNAIVQTCARTQSALVLWPLVSGVAVFAWAAWVSRRESRFKAGAGAEPEAFEF